MSEVILLGSKKEKYNVWKDIGGQLEKQKKLKGALGILTSPKTTAVLSTALLGLLHPAAAVGLAKGAATKVAAPIIAHPVKSYLIGLPAVGLLTQSKKARKFAKEFFTPTKLIGKGQYLGEQIEKFGKKEKDNSLSAKEKIKEGLKKAGLIGGAVALAGAGALGVKKLLEKRKEKKIAEKYLAATPFTAPVPVGVGGIPLTQPSQISPMGVPTGLKAPSPIQNIIQIQVT